MIHISKNTRNKVDKRVIYMKEFPENADFENTRGFNSGWAAIKYVQYDRIGTRLTISKEQAEKSTVLAVSDFIGALMWNINKIEYYVNNSKLNAKITVWEERITGKKRGYPSKLKSAALIENRASGQKMYACSGEDDGTYDTVNGEIFPSYCVIKDGKYVIDHLDAKGTLPPDDEIKFKEINFDSVGITEGRMKKPEIAYTNEIRMTRKDFETLYIPIENFSFDENVRSRIRQLMLFDEPTTFDTVNLTDESAPVMTAAKARGLYSLGVIDEAKGAAYYYNNGDTSGEYTELDGETYPNFMLTSDKKLILLALEYFIKQGKPYDKIRWITEEI